MKIFKSLFFWVCVGIIVMAIGFYFTAPFMGFENKGQMILISVLIVVVGFLIVSIILLKKHLNITKKREKKSNAAVWELSWQKPLADETKEIIKRITEVYKKTGVNIQNIKFFLVMGGNQSGKTTLLQESGHHVRYVWPTQQERQKRQKIYFNWTVTDGGVYIEVPAEYRMVGDALSQELKFLLELLNGEVKKKTIDGVIVVENVVQFSNIADLRANAEMHRKTVEATMEQLRLELPVYLALTHIETVPGAQLYCDAHDISFLNKNFGVALSYKEASTPRASFEQRYDELMNLLYDNQLFSLYTQQTKGIFPIETYGFVRNLQQYRSAIAEYVELLCKKGLTKESSYFRGVYFTGVPDEQHKGKLAAGIGIDPYAHGSEFTENAAVSGKSEKDFEMPKVIKNARYFAEAFLKWIEGEKELARFPRYRQSSMSRTAAVFSFLMVVAAIGIVSYGLYGFAYGKVLLGDWTEQVEEAQHMQWSSPQAIIREFPKLEGLRLALMSIEENRTLKIAPGFYRDDKILPKAEKKYIILTHGLTRNCIKKLEQQLHERIGAGITDEIRPEVYQDFKLYLSLTSLGVEHYSKMDIDTIAAGLTRLWYEYLDLTPYTANELVKTSLPLNARLYAEYLITEKVQLVSKLYVSNPALVKTAQVLLAGESEVEAIYQAMLTATRQVPALKLVDLGIPEKSILVNSSEIPAAYTREVFDTIIKPFFSNGGSTQGDWVLGKDKEKSTVNKALEEKVMQKYYRDYAFAWKTFINNLSVQPNRDLQDFSRQLTELASASQDETLLGLRAFIENVARHTDLTTDFSKAKDLANKVSGPSKALNNKMKVVRRYQDDVPEAELSPEERLARNFSGFSILTEQIKEKKFDPYFADLIEISKFLIETSGSPDVSLDFLQKLFKKDKKNPANHAYTEAQAYIDQVPARQQELLDKTLLMVVRSVVRTVVIFASEGLETEYDKLVVENYNSYLQNSYPFNKESRDKQATLEDLTFVLGGKSGTFTQFLEKIRDFIEIKSEECYVQSWQGIEMPFDPKALATIHKLNLISQALFHPNVDKIKQYQLKIRIDGEQRADITFTLGADEQVISRGQAQKVISAKWPSETIDVTSIKAVTVDDTYEKKYNGPWGLLLLTSDITEKRGLNTLDIFWAIRAKSYYINVKGELSIDRIFNPMTNSEFFKVVVNRDLIDESRLKGEESVQNSDSDHANLSSM